MLTELPMKPVSRTAVTFSMLSLAFAAAAAGVTLFWDGAFPPPPGATTFNAALAEARGWSLVTLTVVLPMLVLLLRAARRGSLRARLAWLGPLAYLIYTYLEFAVSPPFTVLYLAYIAAFACALVALPLALPSVDAASLQMTHGARIPRRSIAAFALVSSALLALAWLKGIVARTWAAEFGWPEGVDAVGHVVQALDLGLQVPLGIATGVAVLRRHSSGIVLAALCLLNGVCMGLALTAMVAASSVASGQPLSAALPFVVLPIVSGGLALAFFRALGSREAGHPTEQADRSVPMAS